MQEMNNSHPAPFPTPFINRIISSTTAKLILDPFSGSGTTAVVAKGLGLASRSYSRASHDGCQPRG